MSNDNQIFFLGFDVESMRLAFSVKFHFSLDKHIGHKQGSGDLPLLLEIFWEGRIVKGKIIKVENNIFHTSRGILVI